MPKFVWKNLSEQDIDTLHAYVDGMPESERLLYGLTGKKRTLFSFYSAQWTHSLIFTRDRVVLIDMGRGGEEKSRDEHEVVDLSEVKAPRSALGELGSLELEFRDGSTVKLFGVHKKQSEPVERLLKEGVSAFGREGLSDEQITNCYYAYDLAKLIPSDILS